MKNIKKRYWACVLYPESLPNNWEDLLIDSGLSCAISPLHDSDINPTGESKKPHYHVILCYEGPTTYKNVVSFLEQFNCPIPQPLESVRGYYRYLTHKDNPEKYQYDDSKIVCFNGFNPSEYSELTQSQIDSIKYELTQFIINNDIIEYADLVECFTSGDTPNEYKVISKNTTYFNAYLNSRRYRLEKENRK